MLAKLKSIWIDGLLEQSLAKELRIALDLIEKPDGVDLPLNAFVQELRQPPRTLLAGTSIVEVFEKMGRRTADPGRAWRGQDHTVVGAGALSAGSRSIG